MNSNQILYKTNAKSPLIGKMIKYIGGIEPTSGFNFEVGNYYKIGFTICGNADKHSVYDFTNLYVMSDISPSYGYALTTDHFDVEELLKDDYQ